MTEQVISPRRPRRFSLRRAFEGRFNRKTYWGVIGGVMLVGVVITLLGFKTGSFAIGPMLFVMIRRLHDINRSGWWSLAFVLGPAAAMLALMPVFPPEQTLPALVLVSLVWTVWLGAIPGDGHENRFGPAPGAHDLKAVFS